MSEVSELISVIKERDSRQEAEMSTLNESITIMSNNFAEFYKHIAVVDEERKHDAEFKKEMRNFVKDSTPVILKAKDHQESRGKLLIILTSFLMLGVLGSFLKFS